MPETDFYKPNPLDSDVIMDATARLLAPRRPVQPPRSEKPQRERKGRKEQPAKQEKPRKEQPKQEKLKKEPQPPKAQEGKGGKKHKGEKPSILPPSLSGKRRRSRGNDRPRPIESAPRSNRQKDSTEHRSLMRPYYLHDED